MLTKGKEKSFPFLIIILEENMKFKEKVKTVAMVLVVIGSVVVVSNNMALDKELKTAEIKLESKTNELNHTIQSKNKVINDLKTTVETKEQEVAEKAEEVETLNKKVKELKATNRGSSRGTPVNMTLTYYGDGPAGGSVGFITASGERLAPGMVASNVYPFGTKFVINGQTYTVKDRGGSHFNSPNRLDVYVPRLAGESDSKYKARLYSLGKKTVTAYRQ
jgi:uncharacterized coiled-coil protein SlyX